MKLSTPETVTLLARQHNFFPAAFRWRGRRFDVTRVELCWNLTHPEPYHMFRVHTAAGRFELGYNQQRSRWEITDRPLRLLLTPVAPPAPARFPLPRHMRRARLQPALTPSSKGPKMAAATPSAASTAKIKAPAAQSLAMRARG